MTATAQTCLFTEGQVTLPEGYQDRTVNVFTLPGINAPAFNISRDALNDAENLNNYIDRQLELMAQHLKGWKQTKRESAFLGDSLLQGESVNASYLRDGKRIFQQQAVFNTISSHIVVFTMSASAELNEADTTLFQRLLVSFRYNKQ